MRVVKNNTETFILTLKRQAYKEELADNGQGKLVKTGKKTILDHELDKAYKLYNSGKIKFQNHCVEASAIISGLSSVKLLDEADTKAVGIRSVANSKLPAGEFFCPVEMQVLAASLVSDDLAGLKKAKWDVIDALSSGEIQNGDITLEVNNGEKLLNEKPLVAFTGLNAATGATRKGAIVLDNTTIMKPDLRNEINFRTAAAMPASTAVKVVLYGTRTTPVSK